MKILELHGNYFRVPDHIETAEEAMKKPAEHVILEQLGQGEVVERAQRA